MTVTEARQAFSENPVILVPMGSTEQHGPQSPMGDFRIADSLSKDIAANTGSISAPVIPYSEGAAARNFPGAIPLRPETFYNVVWDVCKGFVHHGLDHIMLICGDHGNVPILQQLIREFKDKEGIRIGMVEQFRWFSPEWLEELYKQPSPPIGHGGDPVTSLSLYLFPDDTRPELNEPPIYNKFQDLGVMNFSQVTFDEHMFYLPLDYDEVSPNGVRGDPSICSREVGEKIYKRFIQIGSEIVDRYKKVETRCQKQ